MFCLNEYVKNIQSLVYTDCKEMWESCFKSKQLQVFKVIDKMFENIGKSHQIILDNYQLLNKIEEDSADTTEDERNEFSSAFE